MDKSGFDDALLPVSSSSQVVLSEEIFGVYRELARARETAARRVEEARQEAGGVYRPFRRRLADLGAEAFHLRRCVATLREPLKQAGLSGEIDRLEKLVKRFDQVLEQTGVRVDSLDGRELDNEVAELVEVIAHVPASVRSPCVHETLEPLVMVDGQVMRFAKIISAVPTPRNE